MADPTSHPDFDFDTAVSAALDDQLDAYAVELDADPDELRRLLAEPAAVARRAELAEVRRALAEEPESSLDDVTRRRLLAGAGVGASRRRPQRDRGRLLQAGIAAAVTLVVLGAIYAITRDTGGSGGSAAKSSGGGGSAAAVAVTGDLGDLGTVDQVAIAKLLHGERATDTKSAGSVAKNAPAQSGFDTQQSAGPPEAGPQAVAACADRYATDGSIRFRGSGTFGGRPAVVLGIDTDRRTIVFVVAAADCAQVLYSASR